MNIEKNIQIIDLGLFLEKEKLLAISDIHLGYEEALTKQGILIPKFHFKDLIIRLEKMIKSTKPEIILINGDMKHEFGTISDEEWRNSLKLIDFLKKNCKELIILKGNHDTIIDPIAKKRDIVPIKEHIVGDVLFCHGDFVPKIPADVKTIVIGHEHPAVSVREGIRTEVFKCFLKGKWKEYNLIVLPSMNLLTEGTDITQEKLLSPFLKQDITDFDVYIVADKVYEFGNVGKIEDL
ncbi:metallophosphoesterase [Thermoproteota archaeon]